MKIGDADEERAPSAEQVARPGPEQEQAAEGEDVGVQHPGERARREAQALLDVRQGHVDDRRVEDDHQLGCQDDEEEDGGVGDAAAAQVPAVPAGSCRRRRGACGEGLRGH